MTDFNRPGWSGARRAAILVALAVTLGACSEDSGVSSDEPPPTATTADPYIVNQTEFETSEETDGSLGGTFYRVTVDGMDCIIWKQKAGDGDATRGYGGLTCDWREQ